MTEQAGVAGVERTTEAADGAVRAPRRDAHARVDVARAPSWPRAGAVALAMGALLALVLLYIPHWMLTRLPQLPRTARVGMATAWIGAATVCLIWWAAHLGRAPRHDDDA